MLDKILDNIASYGLGLAGIYCGFMLVHGIAVGLTGGTYLLGFIPVLLAGCAAGGAAGFALGECLRSRQTD